ncbi:MAG TPA: DUF418 domain-containing protein [Flavobacteriales bacterium]|jgi:uncharacterized protein|nr:DUF418 domain-containing protein [Flavobacteriales bacterium]HQW85724.1 DUF418 domain-containing protein [Flavobacteriales bacterium]
MSTPVTQRTELLDALRGFALFGVVWSNYAVLAYWIFMDPEARSALPGSFLDAPLEAFHTLLIDGKFYSIFSLLFGIGFGFFLEKGSDGLWRFYRRMLILLVIGWLHLRYLWAGDILFLYAALGLVLPFFRKLNDRALVVTATVLILSPILIDGAVILTNARFDPLGPVLRFHEAREAGSGSATFPAMLAVPDGGWKEFMDANAHTWSFRFVHLVESNRPPKVLGLFLLGLWVARNRLFADVEQHATLLKRLCLGGVVIGLPASVLMWWAEGHVGHPPEPASLLRATSYAFSVVPLAIAFASGFALLWRSGVWQQRLLVLAPMGRMALTNYLMQTIIALLLFTGIGLGWGTHVSAVAFEGLALGVFLMQVLWSRWWLARFQYGPFEWVWRSLTYGRVMPMRK